MASTYALPVSAMPHSHGHNHVHSHSHTPSFSPSKLGPGGQKAVNTSRALRQERSSSSLHSHSHSESFYRYGQNQESTQNYEQFRTDTDLPLQQYSNLVPSRSYAEQRPYNLPPTYSQSKGHDVGNAMITYNHHDHVDHDNVHHGHAHHEHAHHDHAHHDHAHHDHAHHDHAHHDHAHHDHVHHDGASHGHSHSAIGKRSQFTSTVLQYTEKWSLLHSILKEKDSRRIFYFMTLNFFFMTIQAFYGFLTDSLGLLSDSIHMFFDCLALALGLFAAVSSKWPSSERFPYGFGKIESLSGFGNGVFLMLISIEILIEAVERLAEGRETKRLTELLIVSSLGLAVNLVGMACFGHHHHPGHDHSHGGHDHGHSHAQNSSEGDACNHDHDHDHASASSMVASAHSHNHSSHSHENENMRGIFLHVLADTMGSAAVIVSTLLIQYVGWSGWDPLASCIIAILIFMSSIPLVISSAKKLLLTVPDDTEYQLRNTLAGVSDLRGVASYTVPRFWMADKISEKEGEGVLGVMHIIATRGSDLDDVRERARAHLLSHGIDVVLQVEKEGDGKCWCGGNSRSPSTSTSRFS